MPAGPAEAICWRIGQWAKSFLSAGCLVRARRGALLRPAQGWRHGASAPWRRIVRARQASPDALPEGHADGIRRLPIIHPYRGGGASSACGHGVPCPPAMLTSAFEGPDLALQPPAGLRGLTTRPHRSPTRPCVAIAGGTPAPCSPAVPSPPPDCRPKVRGGDDLMPGPCGAVFRWKISRGEDVVNPARVTPAGRCEPDAMS